MPSIAKILNPMSYLRLIHRTVNKGGPGVHPNQAWVPPGHFYSPLLDLQDLDQNATAFGDDGVDYWETVDLRASEQRSYFEQLLTDFPPIPFPQTRTNGYRYYCDNQMFLFSDAFTLSSVIRQEQPRRIIEVGSGFSSAVMLDTIHSEKLSTQLACIEPFPDRLHSLLGPEDKQVVEILAKPVQQIPLSTFDQLEANDILFIDSSHVAKVSSDVAFLFLRALPRLKPGVIVHVHDIVYPTSYPMDWIRQGRAWNESLFLRAFLIGNQDYEVFAFNSFAGVSFPELFEERLPLFLKQLGGSFWMRKVA